MSSIKLRRLPNGILTAPKRGRPPPIPDGYEKYNGDPYIFRPILPRCQHREFREPAVRCCGNARYMFCNYYSEIVVSSKCFDCGGQP